MRKALLGALLAFLTLFAAQPVEAAARFAVCATACTWDNSSTAMWSATTGGGTGQSAPTSADDVTLDGATCVGGTTCTITVAANISIRTFTGGACTASTTGCILDFATNNNTMTIAGTGSSVSFNCSGTGVRTINFGTGAWIVTGGGTATTIWNCGTATNFTINSTNANITVIFSRTAAAQSCFNGGGTTWGGTITFKPINSSAAVWGCSLPGGDTFNNLAVDTFVAPFTLQVTAATTTTINGTLPSGTSAQNRQFSLLSSAQSQSGTIAAATNANMQWVGLRDITFTGAGVTATNSFNLGHNAGISITPPTGGSGGGGTAGGTIIGG